MLFMEQINFPLFANKRFLHKGVMFESNQNKATAKMMVETIKEIHNRTIILLIVKEKY